MEAMPASVEGRGPTLAEDPALGLSHRQKLEILGAVLLALFARHMTLVRWPWRRQRGTRS